MTKSEKLEKHSTDPVVLAFSGGLDSVVMLAEFNATVDSVRALYLDFGKRTSTKEIASAKYHSVRLGVPLEIVPVHELTQMVLGYGSMVDQLSDELDIKNTDADPDSVIVRQSAREDHARVSGFLRSSCHLRLLFPANWRQPYCLCCDTRTKAKGPWPSSGLGSLPRRYRIP